MSNFNTQNVGNEVTGVDAVDLGREIDALLQEASAQPGEAAPRDESIELEVAGTKLKYANSKELSDKITQILSNYQAQGQELQNLRTQVQKPADKPADANDNNVAFTKGLQEYIEQGDILGAINHANNYLIFNGQVPDASKALAAIVQQAAATNADLTVLQFKDRHPELANAQEAGVVLEDIRKRYNFPFTNDGLEASYAMAKHLGVLQLPQNTANTHQPSQNYPNQPSHFASPSLSRTSGSIPPASPSLDDMEEKLWNIPMDKLTQLFHKHHYGKSGNDGYN